MYGTKEIPDPNLLELGGKFHNVEDFIKECSIPHLHLINTIKPFLNPIPTPMMQRFKRFSQNAMQTPCCSSARHPDNDIDYYFRNMRRASAVNHTANLSAPEGNATFPLGRYIGAGFLISSSQRGDRRLSQ